MSVEFLFFLAIGSIASGFVNGLAGLGTALFALGWWLQVMTPIEAVATILVMSVVSGIQGMLLVWRSIDWRLLSRFLIPALVGIPFGVQLLSYINATILTTLVAVFLIAYGGFFSFRKHLPNLTRDTPMVDAGIGFCGGILGAVAGMSGALPTMLCSMRPWPKMKQRAVLQPFNFIILGVSTLMLALKGGYPPSTLKIIAVSFPITMLASFAGIMVYRHLSDDQFRRLLIVMMLFSGVILLIKEYLL
ncbi:MAG: sulfite exporter TauE/SafE family protein [Pseudomonadota bacterium]